MWLKVHRASQYVVSVVDYIWLDVMRRVMHVLYMANLVTSRESAKSRLTGLNLLDESHQPKKPRKVLYQVQAELQTVRMS